MSVAEVIKDVKDHPSGPVEACKPSSKRLLSSPNGVSLRKSRGEVPKSRSLEVSKSFSSQKDLRLTILKSDDV